MKLRNKNNKIISVVIENTQYDLVDGVASFKKEHIDQAKKLGFKEVVSLENDEKEVAQEVAQEVKEVIPEKKIRKK